VGLPARHASAWFPATAMGRPAGHQQGRPRRCPRRAPGGSRPTGVSARAEGARPRPSAGTRARSTARSVAAGWSVAPAWPVAAGWSVAQAEPPRGPARSGSGSRAARLPGVEREPGSPFAPPRFQADGAPLENGAPAVRIRCRAPCRPRLRQSGPYVGARPVHPEGGTPRAWRRQPARGLRPARPAAVALSRSRSGGSRLPSPRTRARPPPEQSPIAADGLLSVRGLGDASAAASLRPAGTPNERADVRPGRRLGTPEAAPRMASGAHSCARTRDRGGSGGLCALPAREPPPGGRNTTGTGQMVPRYIAPRGPSHRHRSCSDGGGNPGRGRPHAPCTADSPPGGCTGDRLTPRRRKGSRTSRPSVRRGAIGGRGDTDADGRRLRRSSRSPRLASPAYLRLPLPYPGTLSVLRPFGSPIANSWPSLDDSVQAVAVPCTPGAHHRTRRSHRNSAGPSTAKAEIAREEITVSEYHARSGSQRNP
jgi:hypothetical protein